MRGEAGVPGRGLHLLFCCRALTWPTRRVTPAPGVRAAGAHGARVARSCRVEAAELVSRARAARPGPRQLRSTRARARALPPLRRVSCAAPRVPSGCLHLGHSVMFRADSQLLKAAKDGDFAAVVVALDSGAALSCNTVRVTAQHAGRRVARACVCGASRRRRAPDAHSTVRARTCACRVARRRSRRRRRCATPLRKATRKL